MLITRAVLLTRFENSLDLATNFQFLSNRLDRDTDDDRFMTLFCGMLNLEELTLEYCSAGHEGPLWYHSESGEFDELEATGVPLGIMEGAPFDVSENHALQSGDILILGTDGIWEAMNEESETFGKERLKNIVRENDGRTAKEVSGAIQEGIQEFTGDVDQRDDITLVVGKVPE